MENIPAGSMSKSEPDRDYQYSSSKSESEDDLLEGELTYNDLVALAAECIRRLQEIDAKVAREEERIKNMDEVPNEEVMLWYRSIREICNRPADSSGTAGHQNL